MRRQEAGGDRMDIEKLVKKAQKGNDKAYSQLFQHFEEVDGIRSRRE